jgi:hypothetical protein
MPLQTRPDSERKPEPHRLGTNPAVVDPMIIPIQTSALVLIILFCRAQQGDRLATLRC